jgi:hypothetical protein
MKKPYLNPSIDDVRITIKLVIFRDVSGAFLM